jgi:Ca2+-transporting ATPase
MQISGLTSAQANARLKKYGRNELQEKITNTPFNIFLRQFKNNYVIYLLIAASFISFLVQKYLTSYVILGVIAIVVFVGFFLEYKAEKTVDALKKMITRMSTVRRNGQDIQIESELLVPGDLISLKNGEYIPADCSLIESKELSVNESVLTGESKEVQKSPAVDIEKSKDENSIFMGSYIVNGKCLALVTNTGMSTKFGNIADLISKAEKEMPLQSKINQLTKYMVFISLTFSLLTGIVMFYQAPILNSDVYINILIVVIALSVSAVPEGLPVVLVATLATGAMRMARQNAIVNRMGVIGTIGQVTVICSDKTGTITTGQMTVKKVLINNQIYEIPNNDNLNSTIKLEEKNHFSKNPAFQQLVKASILCNDAQIKSTNDQTFSTLGTPTEAALLILGKKLSISREDFDLQRIEEKPFSSSRKMMSVLYSDDFLYVKGAPEVILEKCKYIQQEDQSIELSNEQKNSIKENVQQLASQAYRTLALAYKPHSSKSPNYAEEDLIWIGLVAIEDPPRDEVKAAIAHCHTAGIKVKIITGDNIQTATAIAKQVGLTGKIIEGSELDQMSDSQLLKQIDKIIIFARVRPEHKVRIVKALKTKGEIVAMTGDGVNDAPSLKEAHIGIAMGKNGTDVSRSVADITLKDDNFATIVTAIREGRGIFSNIRTFVSYQLSCNLAQLSIIFLSVLIGSYFGWQTPLLTALQILFVNLVTDNIPSITLGLLSPPKNVMQRKPYTDGLITRSMFSLIVFTGIITGAIVLFLFSFYYNFASVSHEHARSIAFITFILLAITNSLNFRSSRKYFYEQFTWENRYLFLALAASFLVTLIAIYSPLNTLFEIQPLTLNDWKYVGIAVILLAIITGLFKLVSNKIFKTDN